MDQILNECKRRIFARKYEFSVNNVIYAWKGSTFKAGRDMSLYRYPEKEEIASFKAPFMSFAKMGKVIIQPEGQMILNLLMASLYSIIITENEF